VGVALGARALRRDAPLVLLIVAALGPDFIDGAFSMTRRCNPFGVYSHGLLPVVAIAVTLALIALAVRLSFATALLIAAVVVSHLALDLVTGQKLLWLHGPIAGLQLYRWPMLDFVIEVPIALIGWKALRRSAFGPSWATGKEFLGVLVLLQLSMDGTMLLRHQRPYSRCEARALRDR
jgi:hypothetical protein